MKKLNIGYLTDGDYSLTMRGTVEAIRTAAQLQRTQYTIREDRVIFYPETEATLIIETGDHREVTP